MSGSVFFFWEGIVREGPDREGTVLVGDLSRGNCPGGIVRRGIYLEPCFFYHPSDQYILL